METKNLINVQNLLVSFGNNIILNKGQKQYLKEENKVINHINQNNIILSTGGSAIYCNEAMNHIKNNLNYQSDQLPIARL